MIKAAKSCFNNIVEVSGILIPREETSVRSERPGLKVAEVLAEPGDTVTAGQLLARLSLPEGGLTLVASPTAGLVSASTAVVGSIAGAKGEALFSIIARSEFDLVGMVPVRDISKLAVNQTARIKIIGAGEVEGKVRRVASTIEPNSQLGQVFVSVVVPRRLLVNSSGRALIKTGQSCGISVPLTAILYSSAGTVVQVVRRARVETKQVEVGLMSGGQVEIREGLDRGRHRGGPRRRAAARRRPGAAGDGERGCEEVVSLLPTIVVPANAEPLSTTVVEPIGRGVWVPAFAGTTRIFCCRLDTYRNSILHARMYYVYILASRRHGTLYIGVTNSLQKRLAEHREGEGSSFVKTYGVYRLVYVESYERADEAIAREKQLKRWKRDWKIELIERENLEWRDLGDLLV